MQLKTILRFHLIPVKKAVMKQAKDKGSLVHFWWGLKTVQFQKSTYYMIFVTLLGNYTKDYKLMYHSNTYRPM